MITNRWHSSLHPTEQERHAARMEMGEESGKNRIKFDTEFKNNCLGEAVYLRDELLKRIPKKDHPKIEKHELIAFEGMLAAPSPVSDAATYL